MAEDFAVALDPEEQARASVYALLSRLYSAPADDALLSRIASSYEPEDEQPKGHSGDFSMAWHELVAAAGAADGAAVADEYDALFVSSGRSEISLYIGAYTARSSLNTPLVALREFLAAQGLERRADVHEPEDHVAMLFEIMRYLILEQRSPVDEQKLFFDQFLWSGSASLCDAISAHSRARFFQTVAAFTKSFLVVEHDAFDM